jgi:hypothetical protein
MTTARLVFATLGALALGPAALAAQSPRVFHGRQGQLEVAVPRTTQPVVIDGDLGDPAWRGAALLTGFSQFSPVDGTPAADSTEIYVMYAETELYVGVRAFETHGAVVATQANRDRILGDDHIRLFLDTFNDRRRAYLFAVNALGQQMDGFFAESGAGSGSTDLNPDFVFTSVGRLTPAGYEIEVRIPFKSLRYQNAAEQRWNLQVIRAVQHGAQEQTWTPAQRGQTSFLAQSGTLSGLRDLRAGLVLDVTPVVTAQATGFRDIDTTTGDTAWSYDVGRPQFGANLRWGVSPSVTFSGTVNPDFSQVEADAGQVVYDPRAAISFPEKRPFFLDASENFETPNSLIYTRTIGAPVAAAKLAGTTRGFTLGLLVAADDEALSATGDRTPLFTIARVRRNLGASSTLGGVLTERREGGDYSRVFGADTRLLLGRWLVAGQLALSQTRAPGVAGDVRPLWEVNLVRSSRSRGFNATFEGVHPEFVAAAGFVPRPGIARLNVNRRWTSFPRGGRVASVSFTAISDNTWVWDRFTDGKEPDDIKLQTSTTLAWRSGWRTTLFTFLETFNYPAALYTNVFVERRTAGGAVQDTVPFNANQRLPNAGFDFTVITPQFQNFSATANGTLGHDDNFDEWSSAWIFFTNFSLAWRPTERARIEGSWVQQRYHRVSDGSLVRLRTIPRLKIEYQAARPLFFRFVGQYDASKVDSLRDDSRTNFPLLIRNPDGSFRRAAARERGTLRADWLASYQPTPGTVFYVGYGATLTGPRYFDRGALDRVADGFFVKASYLIRT